MPLGNSRGRSGWQMVPGPTGVQEEGSSRISWHLDLLLVWFFVSMLLGM